MPHPHLIFSQSDYLIQIVDINSHTQWQAVQIQISWLLQKPTDLDLHCLQKRTYPGSVGQGLRKPYQPFQFGIVHGMIESYFNFLHLRAFMPDHADQENLWTLIPTGGWRWILDRVRGYYVILLLFWLYSQHVWVVVIRFLMKVLIESLIKVIDIGY